MSIKFNSKVKKIVEPGSDVEITLPSGSYRGTYGGYVCVINYKDKVYQVHTENGVRGFGYNANVIIAEDGSGTLFC